MPNRLANELGLYLLSTAMMLIWGAGIAVRGRRIAAVPLGQLFLFIFTFSSVMATCVLPPLPNHGVFQISHSSNANPGSFELQINCMSGYRPSVTRSVYCVNGKWSHHIPKCVPSWLWVRDNIHVGAEKINQPWDNRINIYTQKSDATCVLPPLPEHGVLEISDAQNATPGQTFKALVLHVNCKAGYKATMTEGVFCVRGKWSHPIPECIRFCKLPADPSVRYQCQVPSTECFRDCNTYEPSGTIVKPECNSPNYYSVDTVYYMRCDNGSWDRVVKCSPECGRIAPNVTSLMVDGKSATPGDVPWHVSIYRKTSRPYLQICGGTLISTDVLLSAAHCFWDDVTKQQDPSKYAVGAGKIYRPWNNLRDRHAQKSDVKKIKIPERFQGSASNFQDDIAVLKMVTTFVYTTYVRPACLDFDSKFENIQLQPGNLGKVGGFGLISEDGKTTQVLKVSEMPYVSIKQCIAMSPLEYIEHITSDKICAGRKGATLCRGDSGSGLVFPDIERGIERYYVRAIASTAPNNGHPCNINIPTSFTLISKHKNFIQDCLLDMD